MQHFAKSNSGAKYLLAVIDVFSKYGWLLPLKDKTGISVSDAFEKICVGGRNAEKDWVDKGKEFYNKDIKKYGVEIYSTEYGEKFCVVESWIRTMKYRRCKNFSANKTERYVDVTDDLVKQNNNTRHSSIGMSPVKASKKENETIVYRNLYRDASQVSSIKPKFKIGDRVRISKSKQTFEKGYTSRWTEEIFTITGFLQLLNKQTHYLQISQREWRRNSGHFL